MGIHLRRVRFSGHSLVFALLVSALFPDRASAADAPSLNIMTVNLQHKDHPRELRVMADYLKTDLKVIPDFILCQEVVFERDEDLLPDTASVLARQLRLQSRGTKRTSDREGVAIISRYAFLFYDQLPLEAQTSRLLLGFNRVSVMGEFFVPKIGRVRVVNVHLTNWEFEHHIRAKQIAETMKWLEDRQAKVPAAVTFFGGDFNAKRNWSEMKPLDELRANGLVFQDFNTTDATMGFFKGSPSKRIDFIFVASAGRLDFSSERILFKQKLSDGDSSFHLSDHCAVLQQYTLKSPLAAR